jgi:CheY-specific phosphatase CheX
MPDSEWDEMLAAAIEEVLETMFFTGVCGPAQAGASRTGKYVAARLGFVGTPSGDLTISVAEPVARALAANFLASEDDSPPSPSQLGSVVCELANMICGSLLSRVKVEEHFRLSSPQLLLEGAACPPGAPSRSLALSDGDGCGAIDLWLALERNAN